MYSWSFYFCLVKEALISLDYVFAYLNSLCSNLPCFWALIQAFVHVGCWNTQDGSSSIPWSAFRWLWAQTTSPSHFLYGNYTIWCIILYLLYHKKNINPVYVMQQNFFVCFCPECIPVQYEFCHFPSEFAYMEVKSMPCFLIASNSKFSNGYENWILKGWIDGVLCQGQLLKTSSHRHLLSLKPVYNLFNFLKPLFGLWIVSTLANGNNSDHDHFLLPTLVMEKEAWWEISIPAKVWFHYEFLC